MPTGIYKHKPCSEETKKKISGSHRGKKHTKETKRKMSLIKMGKKLPPFTEKHKQNLSISHGGKHYSPKTEFKKGHKPLVSGETHHNWKGGISKNEKYRSWVKNRRNRLKKISSGSHSFEEWECLEKQYNYICPCCKRKEPEISLSEDHVIPLSKGGSDNIENIQPLCRGCNSKKHNKIIKYDL